MIAIILIVLGLCLGSFVNALVWRMRQQELRAESSEPRVKNITQKLGTNNSQLSASKNLSIFNGHSMCPNCGHELAPRDLVPVFIWLFLRRRCRYCGLPISWQYPLVEAATAGVFVVSYYYWPGGLVGAGQWLLFITWLATSVGLMALLISDLRYMLLPSKILYPAFIIAAAGRLGYILFFSNNIAHSSELLALSLLVASGVFLLLFYVSSGRWIGFGDVRLGLITGILLATPAKSFLMVFLASVLGTLFVLPAVASGRTKMTSRIAYGPFLVVATGIVLLFGQSFITWYQNHLF